MTDPAAVRLMCKHEGCTHEREPNCDYCRGHEGGFLVGDRGRTDRDAPPRPKRRFAVTIEVGGDTWDDVASALRDLLPHIEDHGPKCDSVSGGCSSGHWVRVIEDATMTPEKYREQLDAYLDAIRK